MRTRINNITFTPGTRSINTGITSLTIDDIRLIVNESQNKVICSSMLKSNITNISSGVITYSNSLPVLASGDHITFEIDLGDNAAKQGSNPDVSLTSIDEKIDDFYDTFDADMALLLQGIIGEGDSVEGNSQTEGEIERLRTLQESYDTLAEHYPQTIIVDNTVLSLELLPEDIYIFTNRTNNLSITLATPEEGELSLYHLIIESGNTAPTLSFPVSLYWPGGDPEIESYLRLEINILNNNALYILS